MPQLGHIDPHIQNQGGAAQSGATVTIYREGATVATGTSGISGLTITVLSLGKIKTGDDVFINNANTTLYHVNSATGTSIQLTAFVGTLVVAAGDRLVASTTKPTIYSDDQGTTTVSQPLSADSNGYISGYLEFGGYDYIVQVGNSKRLMQMQVAHSQAPGQVRYADEFAANSSTNGIQEAVDDLPTAGGTVILSNKTYSNSACVWLHSGVTLKGAGVGSTIITRATGSITDASASLSGPVINCGPKGSNGTQFSSGSPGSEIGLKDLTLDGNYTNFTSLTNVNLGLQGFRCLWVTGVHVTNVKVQNTLQDAFSFSNCMGFDLNGLTANTVGQWGVSSARNAISIVNNDNSTTNVNSGTLQGFNFKNVGDEGITLAGCQGLSISNGTIDGADFGIEFTSNTTVASTDLTFSNITMRNLLDYPITFNGTGAITYQRMNFSNFSIACHATLNNSGVIYMSGSSYNVADMIFDNFSCINVNSLDTNAKVWLDCQASRSGGKTRSRLTFSNFNCTGKSGSTRTADTGVSIRGDVSDVIFTNFRFKDVAGRGWTLDDDADNTQQNIICTNVVMDTINSYGFFLRNNSGSASTIKEVYFNNCIAKDCAVRGDDGGFLLQANSAGSTINNIYLRGCRSFRTTGVTHLYGLVLSQTAGTLGPVYVQDCDFSGTQTAPFNFAGTITNMHFTPNTGRGTDIASAATITMPVDGDMFHVTGVTNITNGITVKPWDNGRIVTLMFEGILTLTDTGTSVLAGNFVTTADDTITLRCDGTNWYEVARSVN